MLNIAKHYLQAVQIIIKMKICACILRDNLEKKPIEKSDQKKEKIVGGAGRDRLCHVTVEEAQACLTKEDERKTLKRQ